MVSILGENIRLVRPSLIHIPQVPKKLWKVKRRRCKNVKLSLLDKMRIAKEMGYLWKGGEES